MSTEETNSVEDDDGLLLLEVPAFAGSVKRAIEVINAMEKSKRDQLRPELEQLKAFAKHLADSETLGLDKFQMMLINFNEVIVPTIKNVAAQQSEDPDVRMAQVERGIRLAESLSNSAQQHIRQAVEIATLPLQIIGQGINAARQVPLEDENPVDDEISRQPHLYGEGGIYEFGYPDRNGPVVVRVKNNGPNLYSSELILGEAAITAHANDPAKAIVNVGEQLKAWIETLADSFAINQVTIREAEDEDED